MNRHVNAIAGRLSLRPPQRPAVRLQIHESRRCAWYTGIIMFIMFALIMALAFAIGPTGQSAKQSRLDGLAWLSGAWEGQGETAGTEEHWLVPAGGAMLGLSRTIAGKRMTAFEFLRIEERADAIYYVAQPNGRPPTLFKLTRLVPQEAVFENPEHDYPKLIVYRYEANGFLLVRIADDKKSQFFTFKRLRGNEP